jgi:hypothetical protein
MILTFKRTNRWPLLAIATFAGLALALVACRRDEASVPDASASTPAKPTFRSVWTPTNAVPLINSRFTDNFDNGPSPSWSFWEDGRGTNGPYEHAVKNGALVLQNSRAILGKADWTNYVVRVRIYLESAETDDIQNAGIAVRRMADNPQRRSSISWYDMMLTCIGGQPHDVWLNVGYHDGSGSLHQVRLAAKKSTLAFKKWYTLEFEVKGSRLRGYLDGEMVVEAEDKRVPQGGVLLQAFRTRARFDDFSVQLLP